jgi:hypothetical protein
MDADGQNTDYGLRTTRRWDTDEHGQNLVGRTCWSAWLGLEVARFFRGWRGKKADRQVRPTQL